MATYYWVGGTGNWSDATNHWATASNGAPNAANVPTSVDDVIFDVNSNVGTGSFSVTLTALGNCRNFTASGLDGVMTFSPGLFAMQIAGNLSIPASNFTTASINGAFSFTGSGTSTVTTNGVVINFGVQINGTGTVQLLDNLTLASNRTFTLLLGTFQLNGFTLTAGLFNSNTSGVRALAFGSGGQISITGQSATVLDIGTIANMTITSGAIPGTFSLTGNPTSGTRTVRTGLWTTAGPLFRFNVTAGSDTVQTATSFNVDNFDLTGFTGTFTRGISDNYYGSYTLNSSVTLTSTAAQQSTFISFSGRTNTIQTFGKTLDFPITFNGNGVTWQLQDALTQGSTRAFTFSDGTIQFKNGTTNTVGSFVTSGSTLKFLASTTAGSQATISQASGTVVVSYLSIKDSIATGGATFDATDPTNVNAGNNTGWLFAATAFIRTLFARATSNGNFLIPTEMEFNEVNQTNFRVSKNNLSVYANEFIEVALGTKVILLSNTVNTWTVPSDWDSTNNTIHLIGGGAAGSGFNGTLGRRGGGGGGYTKITNFVATPGQTISYVVGLGGPTTGTTNGNGVLGSNTTFNSAMYVAGGGGRGQANTSIGGVGTNGQGGRGAAGTTVDFPPFFGTAGCGGGGAAGPYGDGGNANTYFGGVGDAGFGGGYFSPFTTSPRAGTGNTGIEIYGYGSGGGGSSGATNFGSGGAGGLFGGGGASGGSSSTLPGWGGSGGDGAIIITYLGTDYTQRITNTGNLLISGTFIESANI